MATLEQAMKLIVPLLMIAACGPAASADDILDELTRNQKKAEKKADSLDDEDGTAKLRLYRLRHADPKWDRNFADGQCRLMRELAAQFPKMRDKVAREPKAIDYTTLAAFKADAPPPFLYIGGASFKPTAAEKKILAQYVVQRRGMILGDSLGRDFGEDFASVMNEITGTRPVEVPRDARFHLAPFELKQTPFAVAHNGTKAMGWKRDGRWAVYHHPGELSALWRDDFGGVKKEIAEDGIRLGLNLYSYAIREFDQGRRDK